MYKKKFYRCDWISFSNALMCSSNTFLPSFVIKYCVLGFLLINDFSTPIKLSFSRAFKWLAKLPSVTSRYSLSVLKSSLSLTASIDMMPSRTRLSNALCNPSINTFTVRTCNKHKCRKQYVPPQILKPKIVSRIQSSTS